MKRIAILIFGVALAMPLAACGYECGQICYDNCGMPCPGRK